MDIHEGIACDGCGARNFGGRRFKCLLCADYDLCGQCKDNGAASHGHDAAHAMQCILTRAAQLTFHGNDFESERSAVYESWTCPYCGSVGYTTTILVQHILQVHLRCARMVLCPICVSADTVGEFHNNLLQHILRVHGNQGRGSNRETSLLRESSTDAGDSRMGPVLLPRAHLALSSLSSHIPSTPSLKSYITTPSSLISSGFTTRAFSELQPDSVNNDNSSYMELDTLWPRLPAAAHNGIEVDTHGWHYSPLSEQLRLLISGNPNVTNDSSNTGMNAAASAGATRGLTDSFDSVTDPNEHFFIKKFFSPPQLTEEEQEQVEEQQADRSEFVQELLHSAFSTTESDNLQFEKQKLDERIVGGKPNLKKESHEKQMDKDMADN